MDVVVNLTAGMGGDLVLGGDETPLPPAEDGTDLAGATERLAHVRAPHAGDLHARLRVDELRVRRRLRHGQHARRLRTMAKRVQELGVRPELEVFDTGHLVQVKELLADGLLDDPVLVQLCMGIAYGAPDDPGTLMAMVNQLPPGAVFSAFSISRMQLPYVAMAVAGRRQRAGGPGGQPLPGPGRAGHERRPGRPRRARSSRR